jgi:arylformamidase
LSRAGAAMKLIDISRRISAATAVFPGDIPFELAQVDIGSCVVGRMSTTLHIGTHADAPSHFVRGAAGIGEIDLAKYFGPCRVVERIGDGPITTEDVRRWNPQRGMRYLAKTQRVVDPDVFPDAFAHLDPEAARMLASAGVELFGIDTSSVDHRDSKTLDAHKSLLAGGVAILENLDLTNAPAGPYELMAFPLRIAGADASPVRAVLRTLM